MLIPLGILAASGAGAGSYELIETITVGSGGAASVTFSNLNTYSSTYQHLQIRMTARSTRSANASYFAIRLNGDTAANYALHFLTGNGSSVSSSASTSRTFATAGFYSANTATSNAFAGAVIDILDPYESKNKTIRTLSGVSSNEPYVSLFSGLWQSTSSLTSITIFDELSANLAQYSRFSIYGLKAS